MGSGVSAFAALKAQLPANSQFYYVPDATSVTAVGAAASAIADQMGGPALLFPASATYSAAARTIALDGATQYGETALHAGITLTGDHTVYLIGMCNSSAGQFLFISDGTNAKFWAMGVDATTLKTTTAGALSGTESTAAPGGTSANKRLFACCHGGLAYTHPISGSSHAARDGGTTPGEYHWNEVLGRGRALTVSNNCYQPFAAGSCRITIGRNPAAAFTFVPVTFSAILRVPRQSTFEEQRLTVALARTLTVVEDTTKNYAVITGNSLPGGLTATPWQTWLQSAAPAPYPALAAAIPTTTYDSVSDNVSAPGMEGQFIRQVRGTSTRSRDLTGAAANTRRAFNWCYFYEAINDQTLNNGLGVPVFTQAELAQLCIDSVTAWAAGMRAGGYYPILIGTEAKTNNDNVADPATPWGPNANTGNGGIGVSPAGRLNSEIRRCIYNDWLRTNWATICDGLVDHAGNVNLRDTDGNRAALYYLTVNLPHPTDRGGQEFMFGAGRSAYDAAFVTAYNAAWGATAWGGTAGGNLAYNIPSGGYFVGLWYALNSFGIV